MANYSLNEVVKSVLLANRKEKQTRFPSLCWAVS